MRDELLGGARAAAATAALALLGCAVSQDDFRGDTAAGRIQLDVEQVLGASLDDVTRLRERERERAYERVFAARLPIGAEVTIAASVAELGAYRRGGGWIFEGRRYYGRHDVWAGVLEVRSSDPGCVEASVGAAADRPARTRVLLRGVRAGTSSVTLSVQALDAAGRPVGGERISDAIVITVE